MSAFDGLPKALRTLCVQDGRQLQDIAFASKISPAMLSSYLTGRETPTIKTLEKLLDGLNLRLEDLTNTLNDVQGHERLPRSTEERLRDVPREELEKLFVEQLTRLGLLPLNNGDEPASPQPKPRKPRKA
ncbi:MAG TPA: helix-turn-helix transcriptional regulator [Thermoanaerobaculia bacterium]|nr:helix-turn-helix transcriptional regulator [Thermoanaerobaculia bacterium]